MPTRLSIDYEHASRSWWRNGGSELWEGLTGDPEAGQVVLEESIAASWLAQAERIPGWSAGPDFAPHPVVREEVPDDEPVEY